MRLIKKHTQRFSTAHQFIRDRQEIQDKEKEANLIYFEQIFAKLHYKYKTESHLNYSHIRKLSQLCLLSDMPSKKIVEYFQREANTFNQDTTTQSFVALSKAYAISQADNNGQLDQVGYLLFFTPQFLNLTQQAKYGMKQGKMSIQNIFLIAEACIRMGYIDYELFTFIMEQMHRVVGDDPNFTWQNDHNQRKFQLQKQNYYSVKQQGLRESIMANPQFQKALQIIRARPSKEEQETKKIQLNPSNIQFDEQGKKTIQELLQQVRSSQMSLSKLVKAVIAIRTAYLKMIQFSVDESIVRHPSINIELLDLEEQLISARILNINDIRQPKLLQNKDYETLRVEEVICRILNVQNLDQYRNIMKEHKNPTAKPQINQQKYARNIHRILNILTGFAFIDRRVYASKQNRSLINLKWQKTLLGNDVKDKYNQHLGVSRWFRRIYQDCMGFLEQHTQKLQDLYKAQPLHVRMSYYESLIKMGSYEYIILALRQQNLQSLQIKSLSYEDFSSFINVLNNVGKYLDLTSQVCQDIISRLAHLLQLQATDGLKISLKFSLDVVNYLLQNENLSKQQSYHLYNSYMKLVEVNTIYRENDRLREPLIIEGYRVLAGEWPHKYATAPIYLQYVMRQTGDVSKINPFQQALKDIALKIFLKKSHNQVLGKELLPIGFKDGILQSVMFLNSEDTSADGNFLTGNATAYIMRLQRQNGTNMVPLAANALYEVDYNQKDNVFHLHDQNYLKGMLTRVFTLNSLTNHNFYVKVQQFLNSIKEIMPQHKILQKIQLQIHVVRKIAEGRLKASTKEGYLTCITELLIQVLNLAHDFSFLISYETEYPQFAKILPLVDLLMNEYLSQLKQGISAYKARQPDALGIDLGGKRQTIQYFKEQESSLGNIGEQMINSAFYKKRDYCEYEDWKETLQKFYQIESINVQKMNPLPKLLAKHCLQNVGSTINLFPVIRTENKIRRLVFDTNSLPQPQVDKQSINYNTEKQLQKIINLQNFKHQLKVTKTKEQILEYIFGFRFIHEIKKEQFTKYSLLLPRDPNCYFQFLEQRGEQVHLQSPFLTYLLEKMERTQHIKELLNDRKNLRVANRLLFKQGKITRDQYYASIDKMDDKIIEAMQTLQKKLVDQMDNTLLENQLKMMTAKVNDAVSLQDWFKRGVTYDRASDEDYVTVNGNLDDALELKMGKAQQNLRKFAILYKVGKKKPLSQQQKQYLAQWKEQIIKSNNPYTFYPYFTNLKIADLSIEDQQRFKLKATSLVNTSDILLIDVILQLNNFLDERVLLQFERRVQAEHLSAQYGIPKEILLPSRNIQFSQLCYEKERAIINRESTLNKEEIDKLEEMVKVFKVQGFEQRRRYTILFKDFRQTIQLMNKRPQRIELIGEYVRLLESQFFASYNPALIQDLKKRQIRSLWRDTFKQGQTETTHQSLSQISIKLCQRMEVIGSNLPPYFGNLIIRILLNPKTNQLIKEHIIATIQKFKVDLNLDSLDLKSLVAGKKRKDEEQIDARIKFVGDKNFSQIIAKRVDLLL